ncbi:hypothetical protein [Salegentibacter chungangensis]|uniref:Uncharacterized protein n=1 Tax=Salegentibacter chungangensis TaxID=1335724 RepID=A0ABW3NQ04_9FLAO
MRILLSAILILTFNLPAFAQDCACCTDSHKAFDFWVGDWEVYDTKGNKIGENSIKKLEKDCIISEHWRGAKGTTGRSYNYYNSQDGTWNQVWIDSQGQNLVLKGKAEENRMLLKSELTKGKDGTEYYNRITWTKNSDESVIQLWETLSKEGKVIKELFKGIYKKAK